MAGALASGSGNYSRNTGRDDAQRGAHAASVAQPAPKRDFSAPRITQPAAPKARTRLAAAKHDDDLLYCPSCTSTDIRLSTRLGKWDAILSLISLKAYRCRVCRHKFYR